MNNFYVAVIGVLVLTCSATMAAEQSFPDALHTPDISDDTISFSYDGNIWLVPREGGLAHQLTNEVDPVRSGRFSPDGSQIAYTMTSQGNSDVYVIPRDGGVSQRISYHPEDDQIVDWHPKGDRLLIKSTRESFRYRFNQFYQVSAQGGLAEKMALPYAETGGFCGDGEKLTYTYRNDFQDGNETWKRYKGGRAPDVWLYDLQEQSVVAITDYVGIDSSPMCVGSDIYFLSDRGEDKRGNLWVYRGETKKFEQITHFTHQDIRHPSAGSDAVVFENDGFLYVYDIAATELNQVDVEIAAQQRNMGEQTLSLVDQIQDATFSDDGASVLISARGEILDYRTKEKVLTNLTQSSGAAERFPGLSSSGVLAYMGDQTGEYQLYTRDSAGHVKQHTDFEKGYKFQPHWSPAGRHLAFIDEQQQIHLFDTRSNRDKVIARSQWRTYYALNAMDFSWSPDGNWLLFTMATDSRNQAAFLYSLKAGEVSQVTSGYYNDPEAKFCAEGAFICLLSQREFNPVYGDVDSTSTYTDSSGIYLLPLNEATRSPYTEPLEQVYQWQGIDSSDLESRLIKTPVPRGQIGSLHASQGKLVYERRSAQRELSIHMLDIESGKETQLLTGASILDVSNDGRVLAHQDSSYQLISLDTFQSTEYLDLAGYSLQVNLDLEKYQVLRDAWRLYRDFYYDPDLHGRDWDEEWERYSSLLKEAHSGEDINRLVRDLGGELEGGHVWATSTPGRVRYKNTTVGLLGIDLELSNDRYRISKVFAPAPWLHEARSPLAAPGLPSSEGKYLLAINDVQLDKNNSPWKVLEGQLNKWVELHLSDTPDGNKSQVLRVKTISSERHMREMDWVESNRKYVSAMTNGRVGYLYVPDTAQVGQTALMRQYQAQYHKEALIVDARFNSGGALGDRLVELLNRPVLNYFSTRNARDSQLPEIANGGPKILITNGWSYSGGDGFPFLFQQAAVGPVLGERTWGGLIGPSQTVQLLYGGAVSPPPQRVYDRDGKWGTGGHIGVTPDILVNNAPAELIQGIDSQLDRSIEWALQQLSRQGPKLIPPIPRGD